MVVVPRLVGAREFAPDFPSLVTSLFGEELPASSPTLGGVVVAERRLLSCQVRRLFGRRSYQDLLGPASSLRTYPFSATSLFGEELLTSLPSLGDVEVAVRLVAG